MPATRMTIATTTISWTNEKPHCLRVEPQSKHPASPTDESGLAVIFAPRVKESSREKLIVASSYLHVNDFASERSYFS